MCMLKLKASALLSSEITNINKLRSEQYVLHEHVNNLGNDHNVRPGRVVVLPSTYVGSLLEL